MGRSRQAYVATIAALVTVLFSLFSVLISSGWESADAFASMIGAVVGILALLMSGLGIWGEIRREKSKRENGGDQGEDARN